MRLCAEQREAVEAVEREGVLVITGGPGTGKTTTLKRILRLLDEMGGAELCAPTGRAAKRMSEATGRPARTIHRLLEYAGEEGRFLRNEQEPLDCAAVVVDEMSMVDIFLFRALLRALRPGTRLVMVGDKDQLPSVGAGNVLKDMLKSGAVPSVTLTEVFRQARLEHDRAQCPSASTAANIPRCARGIRTFSSSARRACARRSIPWCSWSPRACRAIWASIPCAAYR